MPISDRDYSDKEEDILVAINVTASCFSFLGASFIIANYALFKDLRSFAYKLILFVAIGDMINCVGNFMGSPDGGGVCDLQAFVVQFGDMTSFSWVTAIAWTIYRVLTSDGNITPDMAARWYRNMHLIIWPWTIIISIIPVTEYGPSGGMCWIQSTDLGEAWRWICFYIPLWLMIAYMIYVYCKVGNKIDQIEKDRGSSAQPAVPDEQAPVDPHHQIEAEDDIDQVNRAASSDFYGQSEDNVASSAHVAVSAAVPTQQTEESPSSAKKSGGTLSRIKYYPVVLFCCYLFATIRRFFELAQTGQKNTNAPFELSCIQTLTSALLGACNACVYGLTPAVRERDAAFLRSLCGKDAEDGSQPILVEERHPFDVEDQARKISLTDPESQHSNTNPERPEEAHTTAVR